MTARRVLLASDLPLPLFGRGKVRDTYDLGERLLIVATDRISAFDFVLPNAIPDKGFVLNQLSAFWFEQTKAIVPNHLIAVINHIGDLVGYTQGRPLPSYLEGRSMLVRKAVRVPYECVARGYLAGSAWEEYRKSGTVCGLTLPGNLRESQELPEPLFTPTTKADTGHDMPVSLDEIKRAVGEGVAEQLKSRTLAVYEAAHRYALPRGMIIADTKLEFGWDGDRLILIDELLTPDSSRFWDAAKYRVGRSQPSYDKQPVRDWLVRTGWNKEPPVPALSREVVTATARRYRQAYEKLTGKEMSRPST